MSWFVFKEQKKYFNPRSLTGATEIPPSDGSYCRISIHAPLRERPRYILSAVQRCSNFNPRSLTGATFVILAIPAIYSFQSTLPYGSDLVLLAHLIMSLYFNPRSLTGATHVTRFKIFKPRFQSTLPYGSDFHKPTFAVASLIISIHAPLRERHLAICAVVSACNNFNPRSLTGATLDCKVS